MASIDNSSLQVGQEFNSFRDFTVFFQEYHPRHSPQLFLSKMTF